MFNAVVSPPKRNHCWCGPAAISIITGRPYDDAITRLKAHTGKPVIKGVSTDAVTSVLRTMGFMPRSRPVSNKPTFAGWLGSRTPEDMDKVFLVMVTGHYIVVKGRKACDNQSKDPKWVRDFHKRRARVEGVWEVVSVVQPGEDEFALVARRLGLTWQVDPIMKRLTLTTPQAQRASSWSRMTFACDDYWRVAATHLRAIEKAGLCRA